MPTAKTYQHFFIALFAIFAIDQGLKWMTIWGFRLDGECMSWILVYNKGVAFSMFTFLQEWLKYIQLTLISAVVAFLFIKRHYLVQFAIPAGMLVGAAYANLIDRFIHGGVVDYAYWHCGFDFAVFNFADVIIDVSVVIILIIQYRADKAEERAKKEQAIANEQEAKKQHEETSEA
jgi:signal peptidase II